MQQRLILVALLSLAVSGLPAQTTGVSGVNDLELNGAGAGATSPFDPDIRACDQSITYQVSAAAGDTVVGAFAGSGNCAVGSIPLGGTSVDIDASTVQFMQIGFPAGISAPVPPSGNWTLTHPVMVPIGLPYAIQFALLGPGFAGGLGVTQAHCGAVSTAGTSSYTLGDDDFVSHCLAVPVSLYGTNYSIMHVCSNGYVTFGQGSGDFQESMPSFFGGFGTGATNPGVAVLYSDLNRGGLTSGATYDVNENSATGAVSVNFNNQIHWSSQEPAGTSIVTFGGVAPGSVELDYAGYMAPTTSTDDIIIGVTDGVLGGFDTDLSDGFGTGIFTNIGTYTSPGNLDSIGELMPQNVAFPFVQVLTFVDIMTGQFTVL